MGKKCTCILFLSLLGASGCRVSHVSINPKNKSSKLRKMKRVSMNRVPRHWINHHEETLWHWRGWSLVQGGFGQTWWKSATSTPSPVRLFHSEWLHNQHSHHCNREDWKSKGTVPMFIMSALYLCPESGSIYVSSMPLLITIGSLEFQLQ